MQAHSAALGGVRAKTLSTRQPCNLPIERQRRAAWRYRSTVQPGRRSPRVGTAGWWLNPDARLP